MREAAAAPVSVEQLLLYAFARWSHPPLPIPCVAMAFGRDWHTRTATSRTAIQHTKSWVSSEQ